MSKVECEGCGRDSVDTCRCEVFKPKGDSYE